MIIFSASFFVYSLSLSLYTEQGSHVHGALLVLSKYVTMLHEHVGHIMPTALHMAQISGQHFNRVAEILLRGPMGIVLPETAIGLVVLQLRLPLLLQVHTVDPPL